MSAKDVSCPRDARSLVAVVVVPELILVLRQPVSFRRVDCVHIAAWLPTLGGDRARQACHSLFVMRGALHGGTFVRSPRASRHVVGCPARPRQLLLLPSSSLSVPRLVSLRSRGAYEARIGCTPA